VNRRGFLGSILAAAVAPAIVRADSLMRIVPRDTTILTLEDVIRAKMNELKKDIDRQLLENARWEPIGDRQTLFSDYLQVILPTVHV
jgi:hypothetical protein